MNKVPLEILDAIVGALKDKGQPIAQYATLSSPFYRAVERVNFESISVESTDLDQFAAIFSSPHRRQLLKRLYLRIVLPSYGGKYFARVEREPDLRRNNEAFSVSIQTAFQILSGWEVGSGQDDSHPIPRLSLAIMAFSPTDAYHSTLEELEDRHEYDIGADRYRNSFLSIIEPARIPIVPIVSKFQLHSWSIKEQRREEECGHRMIEGETAAILAQRMPNLRGISWRISDNDKRLAFADVRQTRRFAFGNSLLEIPFANLTVLELKFGYKDPENQAWRAGSAIRPADEGVDMLSTSLHRVTQSPNLKIIKLLGPIVLSPALLWPEPASTPSWPSLQEFYIELSLVTPEGNWLLDGADPGTPEDTGMSEPSSPSSNSSDPDYDTSYYDRYEGFITGDFPMHHFRHDINKDLFEQWLKDMTKALNCMPSIRRTSIRIGSPYGTIPVDSAVEVRFSVARGLGQWELFLGDSIKWHMDEEMESILKHGTGTTSTIEVKPFPLPHLGTIPTGWLLIEYPYLEEWVACRDCNELWVDTPRVTFVHCAE